MGPFAWQSHLQNWTPHRLWNFPKSFLPWKSLRPYINAHGRRLDNENLFLRLAQLGPQNVSFTCSWGLKAESIELKRCWTWLGYSICLRKKIYIIIYIYIYKYIWMCIDVEPAFPRVEYIIGLPSWLPMLTSHHHGTIFVGVMYFWTSNHPRRYYEQANFLLAASISRSGRLEHRKSNGILEGHAYSVPWLAQETAICLATHLVPPCVRIKKIGGVGVENLEITYVVYM